MEGIDTRATAFGRVLGANMQARGIPAEPEAIRALAERSGFDGEKFLARVAHADGPDLGDLGGLVREMELSRREMDVLAMAYAIERDDIADLIRGGDTFNDAYTVVLDHGEGRSSWSQKRILDLLVSERDAAWTEAKRLKAELGVEVGG